MSQVVTTTLGGGYCFPEDSIGCFRSGTRRDFVGEIDISERLQGYWKEEPLCYYFMIFSEILGARDMLRILSGIWGIS